jgi:hypothetical protein
MPDHIEAIVRRTAEEIKGLDGGAGDKSTPHVEHGQQVVARAAARGLDEAHAKYGKTVETWHGPQSVVVVSGGVNGQPSDLHTPHVDVISGGAAGKNSKDKADDPHGKAKFDPPLADPDGSALTAEHLAAKAATHRGETPHAKDVAGKLDKDDDATSDNNKHGADEAVKDLWTAPALTMTPPADDAQVPPSDWDLELPDPVSPASVSYDGSDGAL